MPSVGGRSKQLAKAAFDFGQSRLGDALATLEAAVGVMSEVVDSALEHLDEQSAD